MALSIDSSDLNGWLGWTDCISCTGGGQKLDKRSRERMHPLLLFKRPIWNLFALVRSTIYIQHCCHSISKAINLNFQESRTQSDQTRKELLVLLDFNVILVQGPCQSSPYSFFCDPPVGQKTFSILIYMLGAEVPGRYLVRIARSGRQGGRALDTRCRPRRGMVAGGD